MALTSTQYMHTEYMNEYMSNNMDLSIQDTKAY
jgi:hypothetical protein